MSRRERPPSKRTISRLFGRTWNAAARERLIGKQAQTLAESSGETSTTTTPTTTTSDALHTRRYVGGLRAARSVAPIHRH
jgi:hypothetical protein